MNERLTYGPRDGNDISWVVMVMGTRSWAVHLRFGRCRFSSFVVFGVGCMGN